MTKEIKLEYESVLKQVIISTSLVAILALIYCSTLDLLRASIIAGIVSFTSLLIVWNFWKHMIQEIRITEKDIHLKFYNEADIVFPLDEIKMIHANYYRRSQSGPMLVFELKSKNKLFRPYFGGSRISIFRTNSTNKKLLDALAQKGMEINIMKPGERSNIIISDYGEYEEWMSKNFNPPKDK
tara:strand:+ start:849 stop:1397 length:549 start_codon:yes stop_codon:yes gene_type:complete